MTEWGYQLETYKTTLHFWEVILQSAVWPTVAVIIIFGIRWLLWDQLKDLINKIKTANSISIKDMKFTWPDQMNQQFIDNASQFSSAELVSLYCEKAIEIVELFRIMILSEQAVGKFDQAIDCSNNDCFMSTFFRSAGKEEYYSIYTTVLEWKKTAEESPEKLDDIANFKKATIATMFLSAGLSQKMSQIYDARK